MIIVKKIEQFDENNLFFCEPIKNNVMNDGVFIRILYSTPNFILNGIYLNVILNDITCDKYYMKYRCYFNVNTDHHKYIIENLKIIEENILKNYAVKEKFPQFKIYEQLKNGNIKIFTEVENKDDCSFILKISGIWETTSNYGLTFKFSKV
jgi:hypothetical protein